MNQADVLSRMDAPKITKQHWKVMFISGMGFFTDAYDLFIIGVVISILKDEWHPSPWAVGLVTSTALLAAAFGAIIFGRVADMLGRKRITAMRFSCSPLELSRRPFRPTSGG